MKDTPQEILGAFREFAEDDASVADLPSLEQSLGPAKVESVEMWEANDGRGKVFSAMSPIEQAVMWRDKCRWGENAYFPGAWRVTFAKPYESYWTLTVRSFPKSIPSAVALQLGPLGEFLGYEYQEEPFLAGHMRHEESERPVLIWSDVAQPLRFEDLGQNMDL